jgi:uncharacterized protein YlxW (UPF0749 family)
MRFKGAESVVLIATIIVGYLIVINFNFDREQAAIQLNSQEYQTSLEEKNKLLQEVNSLASDNRKITNKIDAYDRGGDKTEKIVEDMKKELADYGKLSGLNEVKGQGILITISDGEIDYQEDSYFVKQNKIFHDRDASAVLNEIRLSGAEAISVNDHRITPFTGLKCYNSFLIFEDETDVYPVFNFYVIGDPELMMTDLLSDGSYLNKLKLRGLKVNVEKKDEIILKAADVRDINFAEENVNK